MSLQDNNNYHGAPGSHAQGIGIAVDAAKEAASASERRTSKGNGHVRLSGRDATLLSQMRNQYRKVFGMYFDPMEFTGNDLYARATLLQCVTSGNEELVASALQFLDEKGMPRLHRRAGRADLELDPHSSGRAE
ncbi:MAG TPA: hypothetical protein VGN52_01965 [Burkholderiales bacterium]